MGARVLSETIGHEPRSEARRRNDLVAGPATGTWQEVLVQVVDSHSTDVTLTLVGGAGGGYAGPDVSCLERVGGSAEYPQIANASVAGGLPAGIGLSTLVTRSIGGGVEPMSGEHAQSQTDLGIPGVGVPLSFTRTYAGFGTTLPGNWFTEHTGLGPGPLGPKWSHNWQASVVQLDLNYALTRLPGGANVLWKSSGPSQWVPEAGGGGTLRRNTDGTWTQTTRGQLEYRFDIWGSLISVTDRSGNTTTLAYSTAWPCHEVSSVTDALGRVLNFTYDAQCRIIGAAIAGDVGGRSVSYTYNADGDLATVTNVLGGTISYQYTGHRLTQVTDPCGNLPLRNSYDLTGRVTTQLDAAGNAIQYSYGSLGGSPLPGTTTVTNQRGKTTTVFFDIYWRVTATKNHEGGITSATYNDSNA